MAAPADIRSRTVHANGLQFALLEAGSGPLALCLHGFPDNAHTCRHLLPQLAGAGFHAVAPFMRGYAPTEVPADRAYQVGALIADVVSLHEVLGGDEQAVLIGHDWGAEAAYGAAVYAPHRWRRLVTLAVPPAALDPVAFTDYEQLKRFFYVFVFQQPGFAEELLARDEMSFLDRLWLDWSPRFRPGEHLASVKQSLGRPANLTAALGYYRASLPSSGSAGAVGRYAAQQQAAAGQAPQPTLYLHGADDGCVSAELASGAVAYLAPGSRLIVISEAGHFLQLEQPRRVNEEILGWIMAP
jgi:pimeloyl-ACP methyl ester carboxylesterase